MPTHSPDSKQNPDAFPLLLTEYDLHLIGEGTHYHTYEKLGAHIREVKGVHGVHFAVWAPHAGRVSVIGEFNGWGTFPARGTLERTDVGRGEPHDPRRAGRGADGDRVRAHWR